MLPEKSTGKVLNATVIAAGPGGRNSKGELLPCSVKAGDKVLLPEYGGNKIEMDDKEYYIFRDSDIIGKWND
jgi:chaperonin GroES